MKEANKKTYSYQLCNLYPLVVKSISTALK